MSARLRRSLWLAALTSCAFSIASFDATAATFVVPKESAFGTQLSMPLAKAEAARQRPEPNETNGILPPFHNSVSSAGNVDGKGFGEQLVGAPFQNQVELFYRSVSGTTNQVLIGPVAGTMYGQSVTAADVNGDGFTDVVVGAPQFDGAGVDRGAIYVYHGTSLGVSSLPSSSREGIAEFGLFGYSVSFAGDVNGDGYDDVVVGAPTASIVESADGAAYLYLGSANGLAANPAWTAHGDAQFSWFGFDVAGAGDFNADGFDDLVIGEPLFDGGQVDEGRVVLFLGTAGGVQAQSTPRESDLALANLGTSVCTAGDLNGDGYADFAGGAPFYSNGQSAEGAVFVYQGASLPFLAPPVKITEGSVADDRFGMDVSAGGDFNGDGFGDLFVGRPGYTNISGNLGSVEIFLGLQDMDDWPFTGTFSGPAVGGGFANQVSVGADVDGDGYSDALSLDTSGAVAPNGEPVPPQLITVPGFTLADIGFQLTGFLARGPYYSNMGLAVANDGDVNGDGFDDALVGAPAYTGPSSSNGLVQLFYGHATRPGNAPIPPFDSPLPDWQFTVDVEGASLGKSVAFAGDVNGDGYADAIVGAPEYTNGQALEGAVFLFLGSAGGLSSSPDWKQEGNEVGNRFGTSVAGAGDVNGDGYSDVLIGAAFVSHGQTNEGAAYLYYGSPLGLSHAPARTYEGGADDVQLGEWVSGLGDVDGDGFDDFGIGAPHYANGQADEGAIYVYRGAAAGPGAAWDIVESNVVANQMGRRFDGAGDVNGDGRGDLVVGMSISSATLPNEGRVSVYHGSVSGFPDVPNLSIDSGDGSAFFGASVSTAGDVDADGYSDIIVGSPGSNLFGGRSTVFFGSSSGISPFTNMFINAFDSGEFGSAVSGGGDQNGDGFGDCLVGEPYSTLPKGFNDGAVYFALSGVIQPNAIADRPIGALRPLATTAVFPGLRSDSPTSYRLHGLARSAAGRTRIRVEAESKPIGSAFNGLGLVTSAWAKPAGPQAGHPNTLPVNVNITGLVTNTKHHWRARYATRSIYHNPTPWFSPSQNGSTQGDVRTAGGEHVVDAGDPSDGPAIAIALSAARPNPASLANAHSTFAFSLPSAGRVRLTLHDAAGRMVRRLVDRDAPAGEHAAAWNLRDRHDRSVPAGVYFVRLDFAGDSRESKIVVLP